MNGALRLVVSTALVAVSIVGSWRLTAVPYRANQAKKSIEKRTSSAVQRQLTTTASLIARTNLEQLGELEWSAPGDIQIYMLEGANLRLLGRLPEAANAYRTALQLDRRPEIFLNLGLTLAAKGSRQEALDALATAVQFSPAYVRSIPDLELRKAAEEIARARQEHK